MIARLLEGKPTDRIKCDRCGSNQIINTVIEGARLNKSRLCGGRVLYRLICARCYALGIISQAKPVQPQG